MTALRSYLRFAAGLPNHFRRRFRLDEVRETMKSRLADRSEQFLRLVELGVFGYPASPYLPLLRAAGCRFEDLCETVRRHGLEATLLQLRDAGVHVTFDEFKGRASEMREGLRSPLRDQDFDNPHLSRYYTGTTGGSSGAGTRVSMELDHYAAQATHEFLATHSHGLLDTPTAAWLSVMPSPACLGVMLRRAPFGKPLSKWFSQVCPAEAGATVKDRVATQTILAASRLFGTPFPKPEYVRLGDAVVIARWLREAADEHGGSALVTHVSCAARVAAAAIETGIDLEGAVMWAGSEPPTPAKVRLIRDSGARWIPGYWMIEAGFLAAGCGDPMDDTDVHLFTDAFALVTRPQSVAGSDSAVNAFFLTTLLPTAPKLMINVEIDDFGIVEQRRCSCCLGELGLATHLRQIHGLRKLTGEGMTLIGGTALHVLEETLPERCGGTSLDYQLLEEEDDSGLTRLVLVASLRVDASDEQIRRVFLSALDSSGPGATLARAFWDQADSLHIRRQEPTPTGQGKLSPLRSTLR